MVVNIGEVTFPKRPEVSLEQSEEIIEKSTDVFASWKHYDAMKRSVFSDASAREMLLNDLAELIVSCESVLASFRYHSWSVCECTYAIPSKERLYELQVFAAEAYEAQRECLSSFAPADNCLDLVKAVEQVKYHACFIVATLRVRDFTPYIDACIKKMQTTQGE